MTTARLSHRAAGPARGGYSFRTVAQMEWRKLRTVRSTWYIVAAFAASMTGLAVLALSHENYAQLSAADRASFDPTHDCFIGLVLGQLLFGTLGVLAITAEFSSGMIRATFAAAPRRPLVLIAKAAVVGAVTLAAGEVSAFAAFFAGQAALTPTAPHAALGQPGVLRAVLMAGAYPALIALISLGVGAFIRHTAGAICVVVGVLFVLPLLFIPLSLSVQQAAQNFLPHPMAASSLTAVKPVAGALSPWLTGCLLCGYAVAALAAGSWALARRDA
jgi:ABC-2 type transport system permease protein